MDLGEGAGSDEAILGLVDSASIACGVHAGSVSISIATAWRCIELGVEVGAHPGYDDRAGFGRVEQALSVPAIEALVAYQVAGLAAVVPIGCSSRNRSPDASKRPNALTTLACSRASR